jgi:hypothetical protein
VICITRARDMGMTREQRAIKAAPPTMRQGVRETLR